MIRTCFMNELKKKKKEACLGATIEVCGEGELLKVAEVAFLGRPDREDLHADNSQLSRLAFTRREPHA